MAPVVKQAKMVVINIKPSPTRCNHYAPRSAPFPVPAGEGLHRNDGAWGIARLPGLAQVAGLTTWIDQHLRLRDGSQGWSDSQMVTALVLLNLAGGESVDPPEADGCWRRMRVFAGC